MPPQRPRGRRTAATSEHQSGYEKRIRAKQRKRLEQAAALEASVVELAEEIAAATSDGVGTAEIGTWLTSPDKPKGVTRQQVYKLVHERVDGVKMRPPRTEDRNGATSPKKPSRPRPRPSR
jgi:hypothetical protein